MTPELEQEQVAESAINKNYQNLYGVLAGFLPQDRQKLDEWLLEVQQQIIVHKSIAPPVVLKPSVQALAGLIRLNGLVRMYASMMVNEVPEKHKTIHNVEELLLSLNYIVNRAPAFLDKSHFPMSALFVYLMFTPAGEVAFRIEAFNSAICIILQEWCAFLDSGASLSVINKENGWLSPVAYKINKLSEFIIPDEKAPHGGFASFNAYFHREIKPEYRPITGPGNSKIIVSQNDGTVYNIVRNIKALDEFWIKSQPYSLVNMLDNMYVDKFVGGDVFQAFLSGADYHRWHSPVDGIVVATKIVNGLMFSELHSLGFDSSAGILSQSYEASVNTRRLVFIQANDPTLGMVCVVPIGITEVSSVTIHVKVGQPVKKGAELGWFSYGGSTLCTVFQPGIIKSFTKKTPPADASQAVPEDSIVQVNGEIAIAY